MFLIVIEHKTYQLFRITLYHTAEQRIGKIQSCSKTGRTQIMAPDKSQIFQPVASKLYHGKTSEPYHIIYDFISDLLHISCIYFWFVIFVI